MGNSEYASVPRMGNRHAVRKRKYGFSSARGGSRVGEPFEREEKLKR